MTEEQITGALAILNWLELNNQMYIAALIATGRPEDSVYVAKVFSKTVTQFIDNPKLLEEIIP